MGIGIPRGDVSFVQLQGCISEVFWDMLTFRQLVEQISHRVPSSLRPHLLENRCCRLFRRLLAGKQAQS